MMTGFDPNEVTPLFFEISDPHSPEPDEKPDEKPDALKTQRELIQERLNKAIDKSKALIEEKIDKDLLEESRSPPRDTPSEDRDIELRTWSRKDYAKKVKAQFRR